MTVKQQIRKKINSFSIVHATTAWCHDHPSVRERVCVCVLASRQDRAHAATGRKRPLLKMACLLPHHRFAFPLLLLLFASGIGLGQGGEVPIRNADFDKRDDTVSNLPPLDWTVEINRNALFTVTSRNGETTAVAGLSSQLTSLEMFQDLTTAFSSDLVYLLTANLTSVSLNSAASTGTLEVRLMSATTGAVVASQTIESFFLEEVDPLPIVLSFTQPALVQEEPIRISFVFAATSTSIGVQGVLLEAFPASADRSSSSSTTNIPETSSSFPLFVCNRSEPLDITVIIDFSDV